MEENHTKRKVLALTGEDTEDFLQGIITNDVLKAKDELVYAALLGPQGKFLFDFFVFTRQGKIFIDCHAISADALNKKLMMYRLRKNVEITSTNLSVTCGLGRPPKGAMNDPRHRGMGWRYYGNILQTEEIDWTALRIRLGVPEIEKELLTESYILEMRFETLNGVNFNKGCYIGQEITARMKHKGSLRKGLARAQLSKEVPLHTPITADGKDIGFVCSQSNGEALIYVRYERVKETIYAADARVTNVRLNFDE